MKIRISISHLLLFSFILLTLFFSIFIYSDYRLSHELKGESLRIDFAGQLRYRSFKMALLADEMIETFERSLSEDLKKEMESFENLTKIIRNGDKNLRLKSLKKQETRNELDRIIIGWEGIFKPLLVRIISSAETNSSESLKEVMNEYRKKVNNYVNDIK